MTHLEAHKTSKLKFKKDGTPYFSGLEGYQPMKGMLRDICGFKGFLSLCCVKGRWFEFVYDGDRWVDLREVEGDRLNAFHFMDVFKVAAQKEDVKRAIDFLINN